jgi:trans-2,3-dihydro-3-hydroxyanthranilate isomerase
MGAYQFETVDVFTDRRFGGNPLAVFPDAEGLTARVMQKLAAEFNLSETVFVMPPQKANHTARLRIFNRTAEMDFAGHPSIGAAFVLARRGVVAKSGITFEVPAGIVRVEIRTTQDGAISGGRIEAPRPLSILGQADAAKVAACLGIGVADIITETHPPLMATVGNSYVFAELGFDALVRCAPDLAAFKRARSSANGMGDRFSIHVYARAGDRIRARMFAPLAGTWEDPATGSANAPLAALLLAFKGGNDLQCEVLQGVEMGRPSKLDVQAWRTEAGILAAVAGDCVPVFTGKYET